MPLNDRIMCLTLRRIKPDKDTQHTMISQTDVTGRRPLETTV
jgi:hypothetical protein